jgi:hypothetical protein
MNNIIQKDFYKSDVYRFDLDQFINDQYHFTVSNVISWDIITTKMSREELKGLADFIYDTIKENKS